MELKNIYNIIGASITGRRHESLGKGNEDGFTVYEDDRIVILAVSDGCSESPCAKAAADSVLNALLEFGKVSGIWNMKPKQIRSELLRIVDRHLLATPYDYELLASTCCLIIVNKIANRYLAISIGDCSAAIINDSLDPGMLLTAVNIFHHKDRTVFANSSAASAAMKIETGNMAGTAGFVLITDGADTFFNQDKINDIQQLASLCVLSKEQAQEALEKCVDALSEYSADDITIVIAMRSDDSNIHCVAEATSITPITHANPAEDIPDEDIPETTEKSDKSDSGDTSLISFLKIPRTAEELILAGYCNPGEVVTYLYPFIREGVVTYTNYRFTSAKGV